jgi:bifunctional oligoribonuclease and PAP phosphatase NrnA
VTTPAGGRSITTAEAAHRLNNEKRVLAVSHEAPDGDALGCISALMLMCDRLGIACAAYVPGGSRFPEEYVSLPCMSDVQRGAPPVLDPGTTVYFLDCASSLRGASDGFGDDITRVNIDHHQDNPGFAEFNLIDVNAPSTSAILYEVFEAGGFPLDGEIATALYVGLVTDTGRFQYSNTTPSAHRIAAELQEAGCDIVAVFRRVYESTPLPKLMLLQRALAHLDIRLGGALVVSWLGNDDFLQSGADEGHAEGLIDTLRRVRGIRVAALVREKFDQGRVETKVSLRSTDGAVDVAALAHEWGGGGHVRAAGYTTNEDVTTALAWIETHVKAQL